MLVTARKLDALDESKVIGTPTAVETQPRQLTQMEFAALEETGIGRPDLDFDLLEPPTPITKSKRA